MAWLIVCFSDQTVSRVSEKWMKKNGKKCYFPKTKVAMRIKNEAEVDKNSREWGLYVCRILMNGERFATLEEARKAEKIAQNHSTMTSFENSFAEKQDKRKRQNVFNVSSASEGECDDFNKIDKLKKLERSSTPRSDKEYTYKRSGSTVENVDSGSSPADQSIESGTEGEGGQCGEDVPRSGNGFEDEDVDMNENSGEPSYEAANNTDVFESRGNDNHFLPNSGNNLESTTEMRSPAEAYDFTEDRCLIRIEKLITFACQELELIKNEIKELKIKSSETEQVVEKLVLVCKDLSVEVFSCTEELKKRNGMFTDLLVPELKLPVLRRKHYVKNELALAKTKIADNMIKYLASTINEKKEKRFIRSCFNAIFDTDFLTNKVWWKTEPGKVLIKKSQTLHCMKESFKLKYGLAEPKKTDKEIEKLIYDTCRNIKDTHRKALKKIAEVAAKNAQEANKAAEKAAKKAAKIPAEANLSETVSDEIDEIEHENYKKRKAERKAKKAKLAAEELNRTAEKANRAAEKASRAEDVPIAKHSRKRLHTGGVQSNVGKKHKKDR